MIFLELKSRNYIKFVLSLNLCCPREKRSFRLLLMYDFNTNYFVNKIVQCDHGR